MPRTVKFKGFRYIEKTATIVCMVVFDMTLLDEARRWAATQLRKRRRVFLNEEESMDISLFSTTVPDVGKLKLLIPRKFRGFKFHPPTLKEITNADELGAAPKPSAEQVVAAEYSVELDPEFAPKPGRLS